MSEEEGEEEVEQEENEGRTTKGSLLAVGLDPDQLSYFLNSQMITVVACRLGSPPPLPSPVSIKSWYSTNFYGVLLQYYYSVRVPSGGRGGRPPPLGSVGQGVEPTAALRYSTVCTIGTLVIVAQARTRYRLGGCTHHHQFRARTPGKGGRSQLQLLRSAMM